MENEKIWIKELKEKRLAYGVSQNKLAVASHITRPYLSDIETGKAVPTQQVKEDLLNASIPITHWRCYSTMYGFDSLPMMCLKLSVRFYA